MEGALRYGGRGCAFLMEEERRERSVVRVCDSGWEVEREREKVVSQVEVEG